MTFEWKEKIFFLSFLLNYLFRTQGSSAELIKASLARVVNFSYFSSYQRLWKLFDTLLPLTAATVFEKGAFGGFLFAFKNLVTIYGLSKGVSLGERKNLSERANMERERERGVAGGEGTQQR